MSCGPPSLHYRTPKYRYRHAQFFLPINTDFPVPSSTETVTSSTSKSILDLFSSELHCQSRVSSSWERDFSPLARYTHRSLLLISPNFFRLSLYYGHCGLPWHSDIEAVSSTLRCGDMCERVARNTRGVKKMTQCYNTRRLMVKHKHR